jgi:hypothetical protein
LLLRCEKLLLLTAISRLLAEIGRPSDHSPDPASGTALNHSSTEEGQSVSPNRSAAANRYDVVLSGFVTGQDAAVPAVTSWTFGYLWRSSYAQFWKILSQAADCPPRRLRQPWRQGMCGVIEPEDTIVRSPMGLIAQSLMLDRSMKVRMREFDHRPASAYKYSLAK